MTAEESRGKVSQKEEHRKPEADGQNSFQESGGSIVLSDGRDGVLERWQSVLLLNRTLVLKLEVRGYLGLPLYSSLVWALVCLWQELVAFRIWHNLQLTGNRSRSQQNTELCFVSHSLPWTHLNSPAVESTCL